MLKAMVWDELSAEWGEHIIDIPPDTKDPHKINRAIGAAIADTLKPCGETDEATSDDGWVVKSSTITGPILTIEARSDRNHLSIIIVNYEDQED